MKIDLAGYNIDKNVIDELSKNNPKRVDITPEVISASYARISRDPRPIDELRRDARKELESARKSNKAIIFKMGHHSIAEHAVFNFDLIGISRYVIESIERFRLCSFTEKSQRYITLEDDFVVPDEIKKSSFRDEYVSVIKKQNSAYARLLKKLEPHVFSKHSELARDSKKKSMLEGWAKEDARYITSLATQGQLGLTINARNLELMFRRLACHPLSEARQIGKEMYKLVEKVAPSLILFVEANDFDANTYPDLANFAREEFGDIKDSCENEVKLVDYTKDGDIKILAGLLHTSSRRSFDECLKKARSLDGAGKGELIKKAFKRMRFYDSTLREFEYAGLTFELVISASCFAQLKRHRMASITCQGYDPVLGITVPDAIKEIGEEKFFMDTVASSEELYEEMWKSLPEAAPYILTNAHRRRVLIKTNAREMYHISRLREDEHAQWDIRRISERMSELSKEAMPLVFMLIGGKHDFDKIFQRVFGE